MIPQGTVERAAVLGEVLERDGYCCTKCGMTQEAHQERYGKSLDIHRLAPGSLYTVDGCVTLCKACHGPQPKRQRGQADLAKGIPEGTVGVVMHFTPEGRKTLGVAAALAGESVKAYLQRVGLEAARRDAGAGRAGGAPLH